MSKAKQELAMNHLAELALKNDNYNKAYIYYDSISTSPSENGAQAVYQMAKIQFMRGNLEQSEQLISAGINRVPSYDFWIAKSFILLSDIYVAKEDLFQARYTLESVIDNFEGEDLKEIAQEKLASIKKTEKERLESKTKPEEKLEIEFDQDEDYDDLFFEEDLEEELPVFSENEDEKEAENETY